MVDINHFIQENSDKAKTFVLSLVTTAGTPSLEFLPSMADVPFPASPEDDKEKLLSSPRTSMRMNIDTLRESSRNHIGSFRTTSTVSQASLKRIKTTATPEHEWIKQIQPTCQTLLKFIMNHHSGFDLCVGEMVHYNIRCALYAASVRMMTDHSLQEGISRTRWASLPKDQEYHGFHF